MQKKGISPQIATVLLVAFVIALVVMVFLWGKNYIQEKVEKEGKLAEKQLECENLRFEVVNAYQQGNNMVITLKNEIEREISKFTFRIIGDKIEVVESYDKLDNLTIKQYILEFQEDIVVAPKSVGIIPWLKIVHGYYVPCSKKSIEVRISSL